MKPPIHRLKKAEIGWLADNTCKAHRHSYLEHYSCYLSEQPDRQEKVGFLDIEASNLKADFGIILSYCIKTGGKDEMLSSVLTLEDIQKAKAGDEDKRVVQNIIRDMQKYDRIVTFYGTRFDIPYIRTRALMMDLPFPGYGTLKHTDDYFIMRHRFCLSSNRLENSTRCLLGKTEKTRIENKFWRGGVRGDKASLDYILDHNEKDVLDLEKLHNKIIYYARRSDNSI